MQGGQRSPNTQVPSEGTHTQPALINKDNMAGVWVWGLTQVCETSPALPPPPLPNSSHTHASLSWEANKFSRSGAARTGPSQHRNPNQPQHNMSHTVQPQHNMSHTVQPQHNVSHTARRHKQHKRVTDSTTPAHHVTHSATPACHTQCNPSTTCHTQHNPSTTSQTAQRVTHRTTPAHHVTQQHKRSTHPR